MGNKCENICAEAAVNNGVGRHTVERAQGQTGGEVTEAKGRIRDLWLDAALRT